MIDLLKQYLETAKLIKNKLIDLNEQLIGTRGITRTNIESDITIYKSMLRDVEFIISWLRCGHNPNVTTAIDTRTVYLVDQHVIEAVIDDNKYIKVSDDEYMDYINDNNNVISHALNRLSKRELEVFLMVQCEGMSMNDTAELLNIKKGSVQKYTERAREKINKEIHNNLFLC